MPPMLASPRSPNRGELFLKRAGKNLMARIRNDVAPISWLHVIGMIVVLWAVSSETFAQVREVLVTEVQGSAVRANAAPLRTLESLKIGERVRLGNDSHLALFSSDDAQLYQVRGPGEVMLTAKGLTANGQPVASQPMSASYRNLKVSSPDLVQGSMVMRNNAGLRLIGPEGVVASADSRRFSWTQQPGTWRFELSTDEGVLLHRAEARNGSLELPAAVELKTGGKYVWGILPAQGGTTPTDWTEFTVVEAGSAVAKPGEKASASEMLLYAAWLKSRGLDRAAVRMVSSAAR